MQAKAADRKFVGRNGPAEDLEVVGSHGSIVVGAGGKRYVDFMMGLVRGQLRLGAPSLQPDILCLAKAITGGHAALGPPSPPRPWPRPWSRAAAIRAAA